MGAATKFNPYHDSAGRFTFAPDGGSNTTDAPTPTPPFSSPNDPLVHPVAGRPRGFGPPKPPPPGVPAKPPAPQTDYGATPRGRPLTEHGRKQATERGFTDERIDAIVENNAKSRVGKVDASGAKTWEYSDPRGNTVVTNESGGIVTVYSRLPGGNYVEKP